MTTCWQIHSSHYINLLLSQHTHMCIYSHPLLACNECYPPCRESVWQIWRNDSTARWEGAVGNVRAFKSSDAASWIKQACWVHRQPLQSYASCKAEANAWHVCLFHICLILELAYAQTLEESRGKKAHPISKQTVHDYPHLSLGWKKKYFHTV